MAACKIGKNKENATELLSLLCLFAACVILTIGGIFYTIDRYKVLNYANAMCEVRNSSWKSVKYIQTFSYIIHYVPSWYMRYYGYIGAAEGRKRYKSSEDALTQANKYKVGSLYSCWYDTKRPTVAQWDKPNTQTAAALISCGTISLFLAIVFLFLTHLFIRKTEQKKEQNNVAHVHVTFLK